MKQDELIQLLIKYKNQVTGLVCVIIAAGCFFLGKSSVYCPPEQVVCESITKTKDLCLVQKKRCMDDKKAQLDLLRDEKDKECKVLIKEAIDKHKTQHQALNCDIVKSLYGQCERRGLIK